MNPIPANIFWPGFIFALLTMAIGASFTILYFAQSDGGPQVIPDYYERSVNFDELHRARQASRALGWSTEIELYGSHGELTVTSGDDAPVDGAAGTLTFFRPSQAEPVATVQLVESTEHPGVYHFDDIAEFGGIWDLDIAIERGEDHYIETIRHYVPQS